MTNVNWDELARLGALRGVLDPEDQTDFKNRLIDALHWRAIETELLHAKRLLDFGCGTGRFTQRILKMGIDYVGIDTSRGMVEEAQRHNSNAQFHHFDGAQLPLQHNEFDTCLSCGVFQSILEGEAAPGLVEEIARVLRPGGRMIMVEQASLSHGRSDLVGRSSTEQDYVNALGEHFDVKKIRRIRSCTTPQLSYVSFRVAKRFPSLFPWFLNHLAKKEVRACEKKDEEYFRSIKYYDFLLEAEVK